jgi:hypothetical protein
VDVNNGGGGGATDIRIGGTSLNDRIMVAGGGAGQVGAKRSGYGHAGGLVGVETIVTGNTYSGYGGTQTAGGRVGNGD